MTLLHIDTSINQQTSTSRQLSQAIVESYLKQLFGFLGVTKIHVIRAEGLAYSPEHKQQAIAQAMKDIQKLGTPLVGVSSYSRRGGLTAMLEFYSKTSQTYEACIDPKKTPICLCRERRQMGEVINLVTAVLGTGGAFQGAYLLGINFQHSFVTSACWC